MRLSRTKTSATTDEEGTRVTMARKPILVLLLTGAALLVGIFSPPVWYAQWTLAVPAVLIAILVITLLWPSAGLHNYFAYRPPQLIFTMTMELWIVVGGLTLTIPSTIHSRDAWFQVFLVTFFLWTSSNSLPWMTGKYREGVSLRPDLIFGGGSYLVRGEIFVALGVEFLTSKHIAHPIWNWWGLTAEVAAMIILVALRGVLKMQMRRARFLGFDTWMGPGLRLGLWVKESFLFVSLCFVVYAFANMYLGKVPFTWWPGNPTGRSGQPGWWGLAWLALAFVLLVFLRGWYKTRLLEPPTVVQELVKELLLWSGFLFLIYGFLVLFGGQRRDFYCCYYYNFWWGLWVSLLGFLMVVPLRMITLREEFRGTVRIMTAGMADLPDAMRREMLARRLAVVARLPERVRKIQLGLMLRAIASQPEERRQKLLQTRQVVLAEAPPEERTILMQTASEISASREGAS